MRVLIAADKFKGSLTGQQVAVAIEKGLRLASLNSLDSTSAKIEVHHCTVSDGGEGFLNAVATALPDAKRLNCSTVDPLDRPIETEFLFQSVERTAYVELAGASGYQCLSDDERDPSKTSTRGTGMVIRQAIKAGATTVYVGIGGSATNDGGIGIASALGYRFLDQHGLELKPIGQSLASIRTIKPPTTGTESVRFFVINDVNNPLFGPNGAAYVYAAQKGADAAMIQRLDAGLRNLDSCVKQDLGIDASHHPGAGAAGGSGYGLQVFLNATFCSGASFVLELAGVHQLLQSQPFDWIITGEGKLDHQTQSGKLIAEVARTGQQHNVPVVAFCGVSDLSLAETDELGLQAVLEIHNPKLRTVADSIANANCLLEQLVTDWVNQIGFER